MIIIFILSVLGFAINAEVTKCCTGVNTIMDDGSCFDGSKIRMNATDCQYKVLLTKNDFAIAQNGSLIELNGVDEFITQDRFCLAKYEPTGENVSILCIKEMEPSENFFFTRVVCSLISVVFLLITILIYILVPKLRDLQGKCILNSMIGLTLAFISLAVIQLQNSFQRDSCLFWAFTVYFTFLVAFFWLNVVAINMWRKTVIPTFWNKSDNFWFILYLIYGFGAPVIFLLSTIIAHNLEGDHIKPGFGDGVCFLNAPLPLWSYFYGPIAILLVVNLILFIWSSVCLWMDASQESSRIQKLKYKCLLTLKLCLIMGVPWLFEVISFSLANVHEYLDYLWTITDYLNSLQGILIFMVLVLFRKKALRGLASNPTIGSKFPKAWQRLDDAECSDEEGLAETK